MLPWEICPMAVNMAAKRLVIVDDIGHPKSVRFSSAKQQRCSSQPAEDAQAKSRPSCLHSPSQQAWCDHEQATASA